MPDAGQNRKGAEVLAEGPDTASFPVKYIWIILFLYKRQSDTLKNEFISFYCSVLKGLLFGCI